MAFPVWRRKSKKVYVYYLDPKTNKLIQVPRETTVHLDGLSKEKVHEWIESWEKDHGIGRTRSKKIYLKDTDRLYILWKQYQTHRNMNRSRRDNTSTAEDELFKHHIVGFFVGIHGIKLPNQWHHLVVEFHSYLFEQKLSIRSIQKILWTFERFGKHLVWQRYMDYPFTIAIPSNKTSKVTPLKVKRTPEDILKFIKSEPNYKVKDIDFNLAVLLGYFAGLGPGELFALSKKDFLTGINAENNTKTLESFRKYNLGSRLSVIINKTLPAKGAQTEPVALLKNDFREGVVNIWHIEAAMLIAKMVSDRPDGRLFPFSYGYLQRTYRENVRPLLKVTPHDLRRSSCLYLGRTVRLELSLLQEHMRHAELETTMLYCREPSTPDIKIVSKQNFDDVA